MQLYTLEVEPIVTTVTLNHVGVVWVWQLTVKSASYIVFLVAAPVFSSVPGDSQTSVQLQLHTCLGELMPLATCWSSQPMCWHTYFLLVWLRVVQWSQYQTVVWFTCNYCTAFLAYKYTTVQHHTYLMPHLTLNRCRVEFGIWLDKPSIHLLAFWATLDNFPNVIIHAYSFSRIDCRSFLLSSRDQSGHL